MRAMSNKALAKAIGKGKKLVQDISAVYNGEVTLPETEGYIWKCEYAEKIPESQLDRLHNGGRCNATSRQTQRLQKQAS